MHRIIRTKAYEAKHGPHFDEEHARKAVSKMENEDGSRGQHWSVEETSALANQYGIRFDSKFNKYDWYVALNMVYSDYYKVIVNMTGSNNSKYFVELAKAWICDKDIDEGKMWYYYIYVMCDKLRDAEEEYFDRNYSKYEDEDDDDDEPYGTYRRGGRMGRSSYGTTADASLPVGLSDDNAENNTTQSMLRNALQEEVQAGDLQLNFRYLIYYNKCNNTYQLVNAYPTNIAAQAA